jgi:hypothetical protein
MISTNARFAGLAIAAALATTAATLIATGAPVYAGTSRHAAASFSLAASVITPGR